MTNETKVVRVIPMFMLVFISSATMLNVFNIISPQLVIDFGIEPLTVSLLSMIAMLMMGVASVVYSTLSDYISIKKLMLFGIALLNIGALLAFIFTGISFYLLLVAVALMIFGGTCGSGLMIITVTKYISEKEHSKYYGYNTACVSISQAIGILLGGFFATYIGWRYVFFIPMVSLVAVRAITKYLPDEQSNSKGKLDVLGLSLLTLFTLFISLYFNFSNPYLLLASFILLILFFWYISKANNAFINIQFFRNRNFVLMILLVAISFGLQSAYSFLFPFLAQSIYNVALDKVSMIILPSYICAAITGLNGGKLVEKIGSYKTLLISLGFGIFSLIFAALFMDKGILLLGIAACLFSSSFALLYPPFMKLVIATLDLHQIGVGIGFFNLMTSIGPSVLIVLTGKMMETPTLQIGFLGANTAYSVFFNILIIFAVLLLVVIGILLVIKKDLYKGEISNELKNVEN